MRIGIDVDNVLRDTLKQVIKVGIEKGAYKELKKADFKSYNIFRHVPLNESYESFFKSNAEELFYNANPLQYSNYVNKLGQDGHEVVIVTSQYRGLESLTLDWLKKNKIKYDEIDFTFNKSKIKLDILVDDYPSNLKSLDSSVIPVIYTQPYNLTYHRADYRTKNMKHFVEEIMPEIETKEAFKDKWFMKQLYNEVYDRMVKDE